MLVRDILQAHASFEMKRILLAAVLTAALISGISCGRFSNPANETKGDRLVVISQVYNEIIWALGAQEHVVGVDYSSTYPPEVKNVQTVGYHRALSAEGILSLHPTAIIQDGNIGPPQVVEQLKSLDVPMKTFTSKNDSVDGTKALIREMGAYFQKAPPSVQPYTSFSAASSISARAPGLFPSRPVWAGSLPRTSSSFSHARGKMGGPRS